MIDALASTAPEAKDKHDHGVSLARLYVLRAGFVVMAAGIIHTVPHVLNPDLTERGMLDSMTHGLSVICLLGIRYPLQMLPIFMFEFVWKALWTLNYGLPQWMMGIRTPQLQEDLILIGGGSIVFALVIPWDHVYRRYTKQLGDHWR